MQIEYRLLGAGDAGVFDSVAEEVFDEPVAPARIAAYLAEPSHHMVVAIAGGQVVGQCAAVVHRHPDKVDELYIDEVGVAPAWQRRGIARRMMEMMFSHGRAIGCGEAWVGTELDNDAANALYEGFGAKAQRFNLYEYEF